MKNLIFIGLFTVVSLTDLHAQRNVRDSTLSFVSLGANIGMQHPFADMAERFGYGGLVGAQLMYKTRSNWTFDVNYGFLFGNQVKEDTILKPILTSQNYLISREGEPVDVFLSERGFLIYGRVGKIFSIGKANVNSGVHINLGAGFIQHKIKITEATQKAPQLLGDYSKGYDRLSNGLMLSQAIGYSHFSNFKLINYYLGIEFSQGFTQNRRTINFDTGISDPRQRVDVFASVVFRWYFPIYKRQPQDFYFF